MRISTDMIKQNSYKGDRLRDSWLTGIIWSHCQPTLPNIRILFGHDAFNPSHLRVLPIEEGSVAKKAEDDKDWKYL